MKSLRELVAEVRNTGTAVTDGGLERLEREARAPLWLAVPSRPTGKAVEVLTPTKEEDSHQRSLSARYGLGRQPLHSDCAHHESPPKLLLLSMEEPSEVPTLLWRFDPESFSQPQLTDMREGLFTVRTGAAAFLVPALEQRRLRFDPGCMTPADPRAERAARLLEAAAEAATPFEWNTPGLVLAIDNHKFLHAREDASNEPIRSLKRLTLRVNEETQ